MANSAREPEPKLPVCCISHLFHEAASKSPDKIAVIHASGGAKIISQQYDDRFSSDLQTTVVPNPELVESRTTSSKPPVYQGDQCFTYSEVLSTVNSLSSRLRRILDGADDPYIIKPQLEGLSCEQQSIRDSKSECLDSSNQSRNKYMPRRIGIYMEPSVEYVVAVLSVLRCGEAFMPLDPSWPEERILTVISSSRADLIIGCESLVNDGYFHKLDNVHWLVSCGCCPVLCISMRQCVQEQNRLCSLLWPCESVMSRLFCYLMYTSGSTGKPKGVCGTGRLVGVLCSLLHHGLLNRFLWMQDLYPLHGEEHLVFKTSISFIDHLQEFLSGILTSSTLVVPPSNELKENILCVVDFLQIYTVHRLVAVPSLMRAVLLPLRSPKYTGLCSSLKLLVLSGEVLHLSLCQSLFELLPHTAVLNLYGSTEVSGDCTYFDCKQLPSILENETISSVPIGLPISNCDVVLVGENAPEYGEIYVHGLCNGAGYFDYLSVTPFGSAELPQTSCSDSTCIDQRLNDYFKTGDFARQLQNGDFIFIGREDRTIKFNGQRIALEEIENTFRQHSGIVDAAVICPKDHGEFSHIEAHLVLKKKEDCNEIFKSLIRSWMVKKLPQAVVPTRIFYTESFPVTSSGKIDYTMLAAFSNSKAQAGNSIGEIWDNDLLGVIKSMFFQPLQQSNALERGKYELMSGSLVSANFKGGKGSIHKLWKVYMESCVDASPLIVCKGSEVYLFIGSHSKKFVCVDARRGLILWEIKLEGRIECSAAVLDDFSQVVVGCYQGNVYFLHLLAGNICWSFQTGGEVKSQPVVDKLRHLVWCGSYDHNLYGLDYKGYSCTYKLSCGGSIFGAPALDEMRGKLFVASTSGLLTAISFKASSCSKLWIHDLEAPAFGSLSVDCSSGNIICCLVDGNVVSLDTNGSIVWKACCGGPIFAGPCISETLPSQVLVCSRDGRIYSFELENGNLLWQQAVGCPITSSPYVDENLELTSDVSGLSDRLVCVCTSSGSVIVLRVNLDAVGGMNQPEKSMVQEYARFDLEGDIFSSPVMIGGKIFVGCRDDYVYCIGIEPNFSA